MDSAAFTDLHVTIGVCDGEIFDAVASFIILHCTVDVDEKDGKEPLRMLHV